MTEPFYMVPKTIAARVDLTSTDKLLLACLRDRIGSNGHCWPGYRRLAYDLGLDKSTVMNSIAKLANLGEIVKVNGANGQTNRYKMTAETVRETRTVDGEGRTQNPDGDRTQNPDGVYAKPVRYRTRNPDRTRKNHNKTQSKNHSDTPFPDLPFDLDSEAFKTTWTEYRQHRREIKKPMTATSEQKALKKCLALGEARAIAAIEHSIANGWQGIFEDKGGNGQAQDEPDALDRYLAARRPAP